jgi:hypothetical protein
MDECIRHILLPFCYSKGSHWVAVKADMEERHCVVFDSLHNCSNSDMEQKIELVLDALGEPEAKGSGWMFQYPDCAQQMDGHSCSIAMVNTIDCILYEGAFQWIPKKPGLMRMLYYRMCIDGILPEVIPYSILVLISC